MIALTLCKKNLPLITELNRGVEPKIEEETTYFVYNPDSEGYNDLVTEPELTEKYDIRKVLIELYGSYLIDKK